MIESSQQSQTHDKWQKTHVDYSRNVKKLKFKMQKVCQQILGYEQKLKKLSSSSNDKIIAMKIAKFCKQRKLTSEMLYRFADPKCKKVVTRMEFKNTFVGIGLKLTQEELTRLEYLLDEDIKGEISLLEYSKYLQAFGLKTEHDPNDPFVKQTLKHIDVNKLLEIAKEDKNKQKTRQGDRVLLTYEQFLKYCHKYFPQLKDKQLAKIFKKLQHDQRIDLEDLIDYLQNLRKQLKRIEDKNSLKKTKQQQQDQNKIKKKKKLLTAEEEQYMIDITTLKGKLMAVMKEHSQKQQTFHSSEFRRVESNYKMEKGLMLGLFREIDVRLVGSVGFNDVIDFYVQKETSKPNNEGLVKYAFVLMGMKLLAVGERPDAFVATFVKDEEYITTEEFAKLCQVEFGLKEDMAAKLYQVMVQCPGQRIKQNCVSTLLLISLMKINRSGVKNTIRPILQQQYKKYFFKKHHQTICTNGIVAYKICQSIVGQLALAEKYEKWDDFEFGPSAEDELGLDAIGTHITNPNVRWHRASALGMTEFYVPANKGQQLFSLSSMCPHDLFHRSLQTLVQHDEKFLYRTTNEIIKHNKKVEESQLLKLFEGVYPLAFHRFRQRGIYVLQFFVKGKWVYVIVDDKLPCNQQDEPLFARSQKGAMVLIVQKAYAKLKGAYEKVFESPGMSKYVNELAGKLLTVRCVNEKREGEELQRWLAGSCGMELRKRQLEKKRLLKETYNEVFLANLTLQDNKSRQQSRSNLPLNTLTQIYFSTQIKDPQSSTSYHLSLITQPSQQSTYQQLNKWSPSSSLYRKHQQLIKAQVNKWDNQNETSKIFRNSKLEALIIDSETIKETWNSLVEMMSFRFDDKGVLLRKELEFERGYGCVYKINSTDKMQDVKLVVVVNRMRAPDDAKVILTLKPTATSSKQPSQTQPPITHTLKHQFTCLSFSIPHHQHQLQLKIQKQKFEPQQQYVYQLSFYFDHPRYTLKERDRHLLFRYVSQYEERSRLGLDMLTEGERRYFYENYFLNADRKGFLCC